jgi:dolichol-phosphate mannosyltransferase
MPIIAADPHLAASTPTTPQLVVIVPVYNEQDVIVAVLEEWRRELARHTENFLLLVIDDGSKDETPARLAALRWPELRVHRHANRGHGQSCLVGYQEAARLGASWVFQIDSDGQCDPAGFAQLWAARNQACVLYGRRVQRDDGFSRRLVTTVLRWSLKLSLHTKLNDTNVPFRLYDAQLAAQAARRVPAGFDLANIAVALLLEPHGFLELPIHFRDRLGGHPSVRWYGFARKARRLFRDLRELPPRVESSPTEPCVKATIT